MSPILPILVLFVLAPLAITQPPGGLTLESCLSDLGCTAPRACIDTLTYRRCTTPVDAQSECTCVPPAFTTCASSSICTEGEVCARTLHLPFVCVSKAFASSKNGPVTAEEAEDSPLIPKCPRPKNPDRNRPRPIPPPDASTDSPPLTPPDSVPGTPPLQPVPGPPGPPPPPITSPQRNGLNFAICRPGTCANGLSCVTLMTMEDGPGAGPPSPDTPSAPGQRFRCCTDDEPVCFCHPQDNRPVCVTSADCSRGELCAKSPVTPPTCTSNETLDNLTPGQRKRVVILKGKRPGKPGRPVPLVERPVPVPVPSTEVDETPQASAEDDTEKPSKPNKADENEAVVAATVTPSPSVNVGDGTTTVGPEEVETEATPAVETQGEVDGVCVDAEALRHLDRSDLVFENDVIARVLCDIDGSCATGGHMVWFGGKAMMMRSYCSIAGCEEKVIKVNSPRYRKGLRVDSRTKGLRFTGLAARYGTRAEESVLGMVIHVGL